MSQSPNHAPTAPSPGHRARIGVIGGSGLYELPGIEDVTRLRVDTPFGAPSDELMCGRLGGVDLFFVPRHGRGHRLLPSEVPYRANLCALKQLGVSWVISVSAVGSLREELAPGHLVLVDQFIDRTTGVRPATFFGGGVVGHIPFGDPVCNTLRSYLKDAAHEVGATCHDGGTYVVMEGPAFSTRAESQLYRSWGASVIGMTNLPEAKLAREAGISYATLAMVTDYDCWHPDHDDVDIDTVISTLLANVDMARRVVAAAVPRIAAHVGPNPYHDIARTSLITSPEARDPEAMTRLAAILGEVA